MQVSSCINNISRYLEDLKPYFTKRILVIFVLGFASGLPILMTLSTLTIWLSKMGVDTVKIGLLGLAGLPYAFKVLWAPFLDYFKAPIFGRLGRRRGWLVFFQCFLAIGFVALSFFNPKEHLIIIATIIVLISFASASQDIVIDAYRIDYLFNEEQSYGISAATLGYRFAMFLTGVGMLSLSDFIDWSWLFVGLGVLILCVLIYCFFIPEPDFDNINIINNKLSSDSGRGVLLNALHNMVWMPLKNFLIRNNAIFFLVFILCFKLPDSISGFIAPHFYDKAGFSGTEIAFAKFYGSIVTLLGIIVGAFLIKSLGLYSGLFLSCIAAGVSNLAYLLITYVPTFLSLIVTISIENMVGGISTVILITLMSILCNRQYSATQYALLSSIVAIPVRFLPVVSGGLASYFPWDQFFMITSCLFIPALCFLIYIKKDVCLLYKINEEKLEK